MVVLGAHYRPGCSLFVDFSGIFLKFRGRALYKGAFYSAEITVQNYFTTSLLSPSLRTESARKSLCRMMATGILMASYSVLLPPGGDCTNQFKSNQMLPPGGDCTNQFKSNQMLPPGGDCTNQIKSYSPSDIQ
jgi:hypothetical protein